MINIRDSRLTAAKAVRLLSVLFLFAASSWAQAAEGWRKFEPVGEDFAVSMPASPSKIEIQPSGTSVEKLFMYVATADALTYSVVTARVASVDWQLKTSRDNFFAGMNRSACAPNREAKNSCEVQMVRDFQYKRVPARDFKIVVNGENVGVGRIVFSGNKVYTLLVSGYGVDDHKVGAEKFIESFLAPR